MAFARKNILQPVGHGPGTQELVGAGEPMRALREQIAVAGERSSTVLIEGESGTGKELVARHVHAASPRRSGPFVPVDCTTLTNTLFESQLFGHVKGAFTGAEQATLGFFRSAAGGTLFLDEIGELDQPVQAKLLRCIQDRQIVPLGGVEPIPVDVRVIAATHRDLRAMVRQGTFREDLFYRLHVVRIEVPPLRQRRMDVGPLAEHFLSHFARSFAEPLKHLSTDVLDALRAYDWPGNVRELANVIERAHVFSPAAVVTAADLPEEVRLAPGEPALADDGPILPLETAERMCIARALRAADGNQARAARMLKIERRRLYRKVRKHNLQPLLRDRNSCRNS